MASPKDKPPIGAIYSYAKKNPNEIIYWFVGAREGNEEDFQDIEKRTRSLRKLAYQNVKVKQIVTGGAVSGTKARQALLAIFAILLFFFECLSDDCVKALLHADL